MTRFLPFTEEEILVARADTGPCHPECEGMRVMEGRWVATLDAERAGRKGDLEAMRTMEEHWTASMGAKHASYVELRDLLRRAICEFIEPVVISHMSKDTQYRTDAEIFLRACLPIVFGPGETAFGLKPDKPGEGAALLDTLHEEGVIRAMLDLTRDASRAQRQADLHHEPDAGCAGADVKLAALRELQPIIARSQAKGFACVAPRDVIAKNTCRPERLGMRFESCANSSTLRNANWRRGAGFHSHPFLPSSPSVRVLEPFGREVSQMPLE